VVGVAVQALQEVAEVGGGELPFERCGVLVVAGFEVGQTFDDRVGVGEVVGESTFRWMMEKKISTWLSQEAWTGV